MPNRRTRDRQLRKLHERRIAERKKRQRQRALTMGIASLLIVALAVGLVLVLSGRGKEFAAGATATPSTPHATGTPTAPASPGADCGYTKKDENTGKKGAQPVPTFDIDVSKVYVATIQTSMGTFVASLDPQAAPCTVNSFVYLAKRHFYDGLTFHRIIKQFVIQGGDPAGDGTGGPGYSYKDELNNGLDYNVGSLAMANSGPNTNGSQFFVITGAQGVALPNNYTNFGIVTKGIKVVLAIGGVKTDSSNDKPLTPVTITKVTITTSTGPSPTPEPGPSSSASP
jgi:cyclophilin family peptidyl-prolyl cis-trans isomerase